MNAKAALVIYDRACNWPECYPKATKSYGDTLEAMRHFQGPDDKVKPFYSDNAPELRKAAKRMKWRMPTSTPGEPQSNGLAERIVRLVKERGRTNVLQSGLSKNWWAHAITHGCVSYNIGMKNGDSNYN